MLAPKSGQYMEIIIMISMVIGGVILGTIVIWGLRLFSKKQGDAMGAMNKGFNNGCEANNGSDDNEETGRV